MSDKKVIKYFGAHYCPHSNKNSAVYGLINESFRERFPDVEIQIYMSEDASEEDKPEFTKADAKYVPTVTNGKYAHLNLKLPDGYDTENKSMDEMGEVLLNNIYQQLDKEPDREIPITETKKSSESNDNSVDNFQNLLNNNDDNNMYIIAGIIIILIILFIGYKHYKKNN